EKECSSITSKKYDNIVNLYLFLVGKQCNFFVWTEEFLHAHFVHVSFLDFSQDCDYAVKVIVHVGFLDFSEDCDYAVKVIVYVGKQYNFFFVWMKEFLHIHLLLTDLSSSSLLTVLCGKDDCACSFPGLLTGL
ncbi:uncharacterized protein LOC112461666, partial [Temnothorax curvispinosus]|uniref:Uncharacterized protein LOC112461666 n=1 Tax=Temnothorax curvispinosus TaxID=300111 RepID=A0A6J1QLG9_9HYME